MGNVTANFSRSEFACRCGCGMADPAPALVMGLQELCDILQSTNAQPIGFNITGPGRCVECNAALRKIAKAAGYGGPAENSKHIPDETTGYFLAVDGHAYVKTINGKKRIPLRAVFEAVQCIPAFSAGGIGIYSEAIGGRVHLDVRRINGPARWARINGLTESIDDTLYDDETRHE